MLSQSQYFVILTISNGIIFTAFWNSTKNQPIYKPKILIFFCFITHMYLRGTLGEKKCCSKKRIQRTPGNPVHYQMYCAMCHNKYTRVVCKHLFLLNHIQTLCIKWHCREITNQYSSHISPFFKTCFFSRRNKKKIYLSK